MSKYDFSKVALHIFVLVLYKNSLFTNKLFMKIQQYYVKTCNSFIKKSVEQSKSKECEKRYHKKVSYENFSSMVYDGFILKLSISISAALLLWR